MDCRLPSSGIHKPSTEWHLISGVPVVPIREEALGCPPARGEMASCDDCCLPRQNLARFPHLRTHEDDAGEAGVTVLREIRMGIFGLRDVWMVCFKKFRMICGR